MIAGRKSSKRKLPLAQCSGVESLGGTHHPHAIEVQDFSYYSLVIDVRSQAEYDDDHIPGAVWHEPPVLDDGNASLGGRNEGVASTLENDPARELPSALAEIVKTVRLDQAILIYCGQGGRVSRPLAAALRRRGWTVDVLPGGWINYRRWVQAGLELLPRLVTFRVIACSLGCEAYRVLQALRAVGHQVLDLGGLAAWRHGALGASSATQPKQAWFESQLLHELRELDPGSPVWTADLGAQAGSLSLPGALMEALAIAPVAYLQVDAAERVRRWQEDEALVCDEPSKFLRAVASLSPPPSSNLLAQWRRLAASGVSDLLLSSVLKDHVDVAYAEGTAKRCGNRHRLPPLVVESLEPSAMAAAVRAWDACTG